jgi:hypothetical protein
LAILFTSFSFAATSCGTEGTEAESISDCFKKLGSRAHQCVAEVDNTWTSVDCEHQAAYIADRFSFRHKQVITQAEDSVMLTTILEELSNTPVWDENHLPKRLGKASCGLHGDLTARANDCQRNLELDGTPKTAGICYVRKNDYLKRVLCENIDAYENDGFAVARWQLISQNQVQEPLWKNKKSGMIYSLPFKKINTVWPYPEALKAVSLCHKTRDTEIILGIYDFVVFYLVNCR